MTTSPAPARARVSVAQRVSHHFVGATCVAGFQIYKGENVALGKATPTSLDATVRTRGSRNVRLRASGDTLGVACSCATSAADLAVCKHLWAALLAVDRHGALEALRDSPKPLALAPLPEAPPEKTEVPSKPKASPAKKTTPVRNEKSEPKKAPPPKTKASPKSRAARP